MSENGTETFPGHPELLDLGFGSSVTQKIASASLRHGYLVPLALAINIYFRRSFSFSKHGLQLLVCLVVFGLGLRPEVEVAVSAENCESYFITTEILAGVVLAERKLAWSSIASN